LIVRLENVLIALAAIATIGADTLGVIATLVTICVITGFAVLVSEWSVGGGKASTPRP
jgi:hypothetical protein